MSDKRVRRPVGCSPILYPQTPLLSDLAGMPELSAWGEAFTADMSAYNQQLIGWDDVDPGVVIHGPPGTGKSTFARALAASAGLPLVAASYAHWQRSGEGHLGDVLKAMQSDFFAARAHAPCIIAIDELDSLPSRSARDGKQEWWTPVVNALLEQLQGVTERAGIAVIGICNDASRLDPALIRAGRLDRQIFVPTPGADDIPGILRYLLTESESEGLGDLSRFAAACGGMTGADLQKLLRDARRMARAAGRKLLAEDLLAVLEPCVRDPDDDRRVAIHEAGHALTAIRLGLSKGLHISIMSRAGAAGYTCMAASVRMPTRQILTQNLTILLSGRAAEEEILGSVSGGSGGGPASDLAIATRLAVNAIANLGLGDERPLIWYGTSDIDWSALAVENPIRQQVDALLNAAYEDSRALISKDRDIVLRIAEALLAQRAVGEAALMALIRDPEREPADAVRLTADRL